MAGQPEGMGAAPPKHQGTFPSALPTAPSQAPPLRLRHAACTLSRSYFYSPKQERCWQGVGEAQLRSAFTQPCGG